MLATQINLSPDLQRLQNDGFELEIRRNVGVHLLIHNIPYVNSQRQVLRGTLVTPLSLNNETTITPLDNHQTWFIGDHPCNKDGSEIFGIKHGSNKQDFGDGIVVDHSFSSKPLNNVKYPDYHSKMTRYIEIISAPAYSIQPGVKAQNFKLILDNEDASVFHYADTASTRAGTCALATKLKIQKVAIVGLGGTGSYLLDLITKTHVQEIHLFDGDEFQQHNAFRAPGAPATADLNNPLKAEYFSKIYSKMRKGVIPHCEYVTSENIEQLFGFSFVFVCVDKPTVRKLIIDALHNYQVPFIDVGMDVKLSKQDSLMGQCRTTLSTPQRRREPVDRRRVGADPGVRAGGQGQAAEVGDVLPEREPAVHVEPAGHLVGVELGHQAIGEVGEAGLVLGRPPVPVGAGRVEPAALVVEGVGDLVRDDHSDAPVVEGVVRVGVEHGRLQDAGREDDLVAERVEVGVHRVRRHLPLARVHGAGDAGELAFGLEACRPQAVPRVGVAGDQQSRPVPPLVRIADLHPEGVQLLQCRDPRGLADPLAGVQRRAHLGEDLVDHREGALLGVRRERLLDESAPSASPTSLPRASMTRL